MMPGGGCSIGRVPRTSGSQGWHASYRFHQPDFERVLRDGLARWPSVTVRLRTEAFALEQECDAVLVRYEDLATGSLHAVPGAVRGRL